jgi:rRNA-processing protein FCF1
MMMSSNDEVYLSVETDPLNEQYALRIPTVTKRKLDKLSRAQKKALNEQLLITIARAIHESEFTPSEYLKEE